MLSENFSDIALGFVYAGRGGTKRSSLYLHMRIKFDTVNVCANEEVVHVALHKKCKIDYSRSVLFQP